jgi:hypothetical protein
METGESGVMKWRNGEMAKPQIVPHTPPQSVQVAAPLDEAAADVFQRIRSLQNALADADRRATEAEKTAQVLELQRDNLLSDRERMQKEHDAERQRLLNDHAAERERVQAIHEHEMLHLREAHDKRHGKLEHIFGLAQGGAEIFNRILTEFPAPDSHPEDIEEQLAKLTSKQAPELTAGARIDGGNGTS